MAMATLGVGIIGCGVISGIYMKNMPLFNGLALKACADARPESAAAQAKEYGIEALSVPELLARTDIDLIVNLTVPNAHFAVSQAALHAGKHLFSEKPLCVSPKEARQLVQLGQARNLWVGGAPDTFLGAGGRLARQLIDDNTIGRVIAGSVFLMARGPESWHPDPEFFYKPGGGPVLDMAPYYLAALVNLIGPVVRVQARSTKGFAERIVTAPGPKNGSRIGVEVPTTVMAVLTSASGVEINFNMSWDVWAHSHPPIELYGSEGSLRVPDPNFYDGIVHLTQGAGDWQEKNSASLLFGKPNYRAPAWPAARPDRANYRCLGIAEMASSILNGTAHRSSGQLASHVLDVMDAILKSGESGAALTIDVATQQPAAMREADAAGLWRGPL
jgi:predicted dehydrogenase